MPGGVHFGNSRSRRAQSLRFTSNMSTKSIRVERMAKPAGVVGSGVSYKAVSNFGDEDEVCALTSLSNRRT